MDLLDSLSRPGQAVKNALAGRGESALRQLGQMPLDLIDAVLPKAWQPNDVATDDDSISGRDLIGADDDFMGHALGFGVDVATDPLTYLPGAWAAKGLGAIGDTANAGVKLADKVLPGTADKVSGAGRWIRDIAGQQKWDQPDVAAALDRNSRSSMLWGQAGLESAKPIINGLDARKSNIIGDAIDNLRWEGNKPVGELVPSGVDPATGMEFGGLRDRIAAHPDVQPNEIDELTKRAQDALDIGKSQKGMPGVFDPASQANLSNEYLMRQYQGLDQDPLAELMGRGAPGKSGVMKARKNSDWRDVANTLEQNPDATYVRSLVDRLAKRAQSSVDLAKRAGAGQAVFDAMKAGKVGVPEETLLDELTKLRAGSVKPPVPESGASADVGAMLGGAPAEAAAVADPYGTVLGAGKQKISEQADVSSMLGGKPVEAAEPAGIEGANQSVIPDQTGKSVVGAGAKQPSLSLSDFKPDEIETATKNILGKDFHLSDPWAMDTARKAIGLMAASGSPETAKMALDQLQGIGSRGAFWKTLASSNAWFKKFASYGVVVPKVGKIFRNRLNGPMQAFSSDATRGATLDMLKTIPPDLTGAVADAVGRRGMDQASGTIEEWEHALANSKGDPRQAIDAFSAQHPEVGAFIKHGGMDGFVRGDDLIADASRPGWLQKLKSIADFPGRLTRGIEDRMRLQLGKAQVDKYVAEGMSLDDAAKAAVKDTGDALYRYSANSANNQKLKDLIPYASWSTNAIPAELKMMAKHPAYASVASHAMQRDPHEDPLYPYMDDQVNFDLGKDSTGNRQVVNGFGFPFETLAEIPNPLAPIGQFGRQIEKNVVGQASPVLKAGYGLVTGRDPNFETPFGTYDKIPVIGDAGEAGRLYNMAQSTGALSPIDTPLKQIDQVLDPRRDAVTKALGLLTGANIATVDPVRAQAQRLQEELDRNPDVSSIAHLTSKDQDAKQLIDELQAVQKKMKDRRKAMTVAGH